MTRSTTETQTSTVTGAIGDSPLRPDGTLKVKGEFAYSSDLWARGHALGRHAAQPAPARPHPRHRHRPRAGRCPACTRC